MSKQSKDKCICTCYNITKADMKQAIKDGVTRFKDYSELTKIGQKCSSCKSKSKKRFTKYKRKLGV